MVESKPDPSPIVHVSRVRPQNFSLYKYLGDTQNTPQNGCSAGTGKCHFNHGCEPNTPFSETLNSCRNTTDRTTRVRRSPIWESCGIKGCRETSPAGVSVGDTIKTDGKSLMPVGDWISRSNRKSPPSDTEGVFPWIKIRDFQWGYGNYRPVRCRQIVVLVWRIIDRCDASQDGRLDRITPNLSQRCPLCVPT